MKIETDRYKLYNGDCLEVMDKLIEEGVIFDAIITDPPYGTTNCRWDSVIPFDKMWDRINKLIKPTGAIVLFSNEPFTSLLICSNLKGFKYRWDWNKKIPTGIGYAKYRPMQQTEDICVFTKNGEKTIYNPQMIERTEKEEREFIKKKGKDYTPQKNDMFIGIKSKAFFHTSDPKYKYPVNLLNFNARSKECNNRVRVHPTQKPVDLLEYLIKTYTNENDLVLDFTMGSGSTGVACLNTNRKFIGIELDENYFNIAKERIENNIK